MPRYSRMQLSNRKPLISHPCTTASPRAYIQTYRSKPGPCLYPAGLDELLAEVFGGLGGLGGSSRQWQEVELEEEDDEEEVGRPNRQLLFSGIPSLREHILSMF